MTIKSIIIFLLLLSSNNILAASSWNKSNDKIHKNAEKAMSEGNFAIAYCLWEPLAQEGNSKAQFNIGWMYHNGYGLAINDSTALSWWLKSAEQGNTDAFYTLADLYLAGFGVDKDKDVAMGWYIAAAERGHEASLEIIHALPQRKDKLSKKYYSDLISSHWYLKEALKGDKKSLQIITSLASSSDVKKQQYLSNAFKNNWGIFEPKMRIKVARANVRRGPSTQHKIITSLSQDHELVKLSSKGNWTQIGIQGSGEIAWVFNSLIEMIITQAEPL